MCVNFLPSPPIRHTANASFHGVSLYFSDDDILSEFSGPACDKPESESESGWSLIADNSDVISLADTSRSTTDFEHTQDTFEVAKSTSSNNGMKSDEWRGPLTLVEIAKIASKGQSYEILKSIWGRVGTTINLFTPVWVIDTRAPSREEHIKQMDMIKKKTEIDKKLVRAAGDIDYFAAQVKLDASMKENDKQALWVRFSQNVRQAQRVEDAITQKFEGIFLGF